MPSRAELDVLKERKSTSSTGIRTLDHPARSLVAISTTLCLLSLRVDRYTKLKIILRKLDVKSMIFE